MNERILNQFASYFKRIIRIEKYLKNLITEKYTQTYGSKTYDKLYNTYFKKLRTSHNCKNNVFNDIFKLKNKTSAEKLNLSVDKMYISEVLSFFSTKVFLKDITRKNFFNKTIKTNKNDFRQTSKQLKEFRNCICHYDIKQFSLGKNKFVNALLYFEKLLDCRYRFTSGSIDSISHKLSIKSILELIYSNNPEYFNDDRILVNVFDDLAILSGFREDNLPQYKSIIRQKFRIESKE